MDRIGKNIMALGLLAVALYVSASGVLLIWRHIGPSILSAIGEYLPDASCEETRGRGWHEDSDIGCRHVCETKAYPKEEAECWQYHLDQNLRDREELMGAMPGG